MHYALAFLVTAMMAFIPTEVSDQKNACEWTNPCMGGPCGVGCDLKIESGPQYLTPKGACWTTLTLTVTCPGNPSTTCTVTKGVACASEEVQSITCGGCKFTADPDGAGGGDCDDANWGSMGETSRCGCVTIACSS